MKFAIQFPIYFLHTLFLRSKYSPQHPVLRHLKSVFIHYRETMFHTQQTMFQKNQSRPLALCGIAYHSVLLREDLSAHRPPSKLSDRLLSTVRESYIR
jgi:hypothetical protein